MYCGGAPAAGGFSSRSGAIESGESDSLTGTGLSAGLAFHDRVGLCRVPFLHPLQATLLGRGEALSLDRVDVDDDRAVGLERLAQRFAQRAHVVAVDDPHVGEIELLEEEARRPVGLDRRLDLRPEPFDPLAEPQGQPREAVLDALARVVEPRIQPHTVEVARERADVRRDRHPVVVEHDHDRRLQAARRVQRLVGHAPGEGPVADHGCDLAVLPDPLAHRLLEADGVADRGRGMARAHDVVLGLEDRAEGGESLVLAYRGQRLAAPGEDLVRVGLVAHVPEDLVARRVEQAVKGDGQLAGAEVGAEVAADLADRVDDVGAHLLRDLLQLLVVESVKVGRRVDFLEQRVPGVGPVLPLV